MTTFYNDLKTPYDVKSIMHYQSNAFAKAGTYTLLSRTAPQVILRNLLITDIDATEIMLLYNCAAPSTTPIPTSTASKTTTKQTTTTTKPTTTTTKPTTTTTKPTTTTTKSVTTKPLQWFEELGNSYSISCNFPGNDLSNVRLVATSCSFRCRTTLGCTHYYWAADFCYLKSNITVTKAGAVSNNNNLTFCGILSKGSMAKN